jgi:hypothetical protein
MAKLTIIETHEQYKISRQRQVSIESVEMRPEFKKYLLNSRKIAVKKFFFCQKGVNFKNI